MFSHVFVCPQGADISGPMPFPWRVGISGNRSILGVGGISIRWVPIPLSTHGPVIPWDMVDKQTVLVLLESVLVLVFYCMNFYSLLDLILDAPVLWDILELDSDLIIKLEASKLKGIRKGV